MEIGSCKGNLAILAEDDERLNDFAEYIRLETLQFPVAVDSFSSLPHFGQMKAPDLVNSQDAIPLIYQPKNAPTVTRNKKSAKSFELMTKRQTDTGIKRTRKPSASKAKKPPKKDGYSWRRDGSGFELRKTVYDVSDTGISKRRLPYVAHLSKSAFAEMKKRHKGAALEKAISQWIAKHDR